MCSPLDRQAGKEHQQCFQTMFHTTVSRRACPRMQRHGAKVSGAARGKGGLLPKRTMTKHSTFAVSTRAPLKRAAAAAVAPSVRRRRWCLCYDGPVNLPWMSECCCRTTLLISPPAPSNASLVEHPPTSAVSLWLILPDQFAVIVCRIGHFPVSVVQ